MRTAIFHTCVWAFVLTAVAVGVPQDKGRKESPTVRTQPHSVNLHWDAPKEGSAVIAFNIYRADASNRGGKISCVADFKKIAVVQMPSTSYPELIRPYLGPFC